MMINQMANYVHGSSLQDHLIHEQDIHFQLVLVLYCSKNTILKLFMLHAPIMNYILYTWRYSSGVEIIPPQRVTLA